MTSFTSSCFGLLICIIVNLAYGTSGKENTTGDLILFEKLFVERREEHKAAVQALLTMQDYQKQHKMITLTLQRVFEVLHSSQERLRRAGHVPGSSFPGDEAVRDALSQTLETTCLLGEVVLHLPSITHSVLRQLGKENEQLKTLLAWGVFFTAHTTFLPAATKRLVHLMTQELGLADRDPDYVNPYVPKPTDDNATKKKPKPKKKSFKKGPTLSRQYGDL